MQPKIFFQQDGAPPHWGVEVREFFNFTFPQRSPDLTPLDFFFWGFVKDSVYKREINDLDELKEEILNAVSKVNENMLNGTMNEFKKRLELLKRNNGAHFELW